MLLAVSLFTIISSMLFYKANMRKAYIFTKKCHNIVIQSKVQELEQFFAVSCFILLQGVKGKFNISAVPYMDCFMGKESLLVYYDFSFTMH